MGMTPGRLGSLASWLAFLGVLAQAVVQWMLITKRGQRLGKIAMAIHIRKQDGSPVDFVSGVVLRIWALGLIVGVVNAVTHLSLSDLLQTDYGRILVLKVLVAALAFVIGFYNWRVVQPSLKTDPRASLLRIPAAVELTAALAVLAVTAALVVTARS